jgi:hypothetical protein
VAEADAFTGQTVKRGRLNHPISVTTKVVSAQSVNRDEKDVRMRRLLLRHAAGHARTPNTYQKEANSLHLYGE